MLMLMVNRMTLIMTRMRSMPTVCLRVLGRPRLLATSLSSVKVHLLQKSAFLFSDSSRLLCVQYSLQGQNAFYSPCHFVSILLVGHSVGSLQTDGQKVESRAGFRLGRLRNKFDENLLAIFLTI